MTLTQAPGHAAARAMERFGITLTVDDLRQIMLDIIDSVAGERRAAVLQARLPDGTERWFVRVRGAALRVAYKPKDAAIVTVLPLAGGTPEIRVSRQQQQGRPRRERFAEERAL